ncbi:MAG: J domain-containing protein [Candidatus Pacebacteria bacterium]|nr:J domain-containing protein [Candidatus Paceibacterota bacterium]
MPFNERNFGNFSENKEQRQDNRTHYEILGVREEATAEEVKSAWRQRMMLFHPDKYEQRVREGYASSKESFEEEAKKINDAYTVLKDPEKRTAYDNLRRTNNPTQPVRQEQKTEKGAGPEAGFYDKYKKTEDEWKKYKQQKEEGPQLIDWGEKKKATKIRSTSHRE